MRHIMLRLRTARIFENWWSGLRLSAMGGEGERVIAEKLRAALVLMMGIAVYDFWAGREISLWVLYVVPIAVISWYKGAKAGAASSGLAVVFLYVVGVWSGHPYSSVFYFCVATLSQAIAYVMIVFLVTAQRGLLRQSSAPPEFPHPMAVQRTQSEEAQSRVPIMGGIWNTHPAIALLRGLQEMTGPGASYEGKRIDVASFMEATRARVKPLYGGFPLTERQLERIAEDAGFRIVVTPTDIRLASRHADSP
jgi:hypothetical protein